MCVHVYVPRNLQIALRKLKINRMSANLQIGTQSADCEILIAQTVKPQVLLQQPQIPPLLYNMFLLQTKNKYKIKTDIVVLEVLLKGIIIHN